MNKKANTRLKVEAAEAVPQSLAEVTEAIAEIGRCQRERDVIQAQMNEALSFWRAKYEEKAKPYAGRIVELTKGVATWCEAHRGELTKEGKTKTARLATGEVSWRMRPPSIVLRGAEAVIDALRKLGMDRFLRVKVEVDKNAMLAEPEAVAKIKGVSISQREEFVVKPFSTELEEVR